jgi:hypothetical protein
MMVTVTPKAALMTSVWAGHPKVMFWATAHTGGEWELHSGGLVVTVTATVRFCGGFTYALAPEGDPMNPGVWRDFQNAIQGFSVTVWELPDQ